MLRIRLFLDEKKMTGMTILVVVDYLVSVKRCTLQVNWKERFSDFMVQKEI